MSLAVSDDMFDSADVAGGADSSFLLDSKLLSRRRAFVVLVTRISCYAVSLRRAILFCCRAADDVT